MALLDMVISELGGDSTRVVATGQSIAALCTLLMLHLLLRPEECLATPWAYVVELSQPLFGPEATFVISAPRPPAGSRFADTRTDADGC